MNRYGLLGPATVHLDGIEMNLGSPQQRVIFALLLLNRNEVVTTDRMADVLWPRGLPDNAVAVLRTYVSRLRATAVPPGALSTRPGGYELSTSRGEVDADRLEDLVTQARAHSQRGDSAAAEELLTGALHLLRGPVLPELPDDEPAMAERARLDELCAIARQELTEARLAQGDHRELLPDLRRALADDPLRDRVWGQLMVALYRSGRQAEALDAYRRARRALTDAGLTPGPALRELERMVLLHDVALAEPSMHTRQLPRYTTSLVGRAAELDAVAELLQAAGLVSIVGPAGAGKTRLAVETAHRAGQRLVSRVWWVDLSTVGPGRVIAATARALSVPQIPGRTPVDGIAARLADVPSLLILDNCEHVTDDAAALVAWLLHNDVRILTTTREPLRLRAERVLHLTGLSGEPAVRLFQDRAGERVDTVATVAEIVTQLDGLPLAIELAADKLRILSPAELSRGIHERSLLLVDGPRDAPPRHHSLSAAIAWSYDLRPPGERQFLRRLAVFPGGFDAVAAQAVGGGEAGLPILTRLVDASLVAADPPRYQLLMTVRSFLLDRLRDAGEETSALERHRDAYLVLAETVGRNMVDRGLGPWLARGHLEHENFLAALHFSFQRGDTDEAFSMATWVAFFWFRSGFVRDGLELLDRAMAGVDHDHSLWPRASLMRALLASAAGAPDAAWATEKAVEAAEKAADAELTALSLCWRGHARLVARRLDEARIDLRRAQCVAAQAGSQEGLAFSDQLLGDLAMLEGDLGAADDLLVRARDRYRRSRVGVDAGYALIDLARVRLAQHRYAEALATAGDALTDFRVRADARGLAGALRCLGRAYTGLGERDHARAALEESRVIAARWGGALWDSGQGDEAGEEPAFGLSVEPLREVRSGTRLEAADVGE